MQVWISVNEADIGSIHAGQPVNFTVDAFPNRVFEGTVGKIRLNATMTQNVVTYTVEVNTDNTDGKLLPYLTANAQFLTAERHNVLLVPNAALRWRPQPDLIAREFRQSAPGPSAGHPADPSDQPGPHHSSTLWVADGDFVRPVHVTIGLSDGTQTEVEGKELTEGTQIVLGLQVASILADTDAANNPFAPQMPWSRRPSSPRRPSP
jgi:HlyD family secretion protein